MKSKVKFDLNASNEAVITAQIIFDSEDVRDKVARTFHEGLGYWSNLAHVQIHPDIEIKGLKNVNGITLDETLKGRQIQIKTFGGQYEETQALCKNLCSEQLENLLKAIPFELKDRKKLAQVKEIK